MARLQYAINVTLDGCCDHRAGMPDPDMHQFWADVVGRASVLLYGRVTYQMMEDAWRPIGESGLVPDGMADWVAPFAHSIHKARKVVASTTLTQLDWNSELLEGDLEAAVERLKREEDGVISLGGVDLAGQIAALGLIDDYVFVVNPRIAGHGPTLFAGLPAYIDLKLTSQRTFGSGALALTYEARHY
ncbi:MAG: dihydrofolate reductase family protein [Candidatus Devosia phytovorans]|uniref:Dihydrofolate reductase family protein n=1 Tax=Candidatus Devosia phytovorans TaxID=3121372 RepID=A0AAJ6B040_9HYPH|nr:dihydrofolate reductase family protein [Devosia sp.]WEK04446.1 MAG: dihydrofolate reductase family protein [Devosia sp.]